MLTNSSNAQNYLATASVACAVGGHILQGFAARTAAFSVEHCHIEGTVTRSWLSCVKHTLALLLQLCRHLQSLQSAYDACNITTFA